MKNDYSERILGRSEKAVYDMRVLYEGLGYKKYKMRKFEEYDLYLENKSFLKSNSIITFTDFGGKLLALKPDVTLSIAKNAPTGGDAQKLYYTENVYRESRAGNEYKEIMQVGLEYIGDIDLYILAEVISLASKSLAAVSDKYIMDISHLGFVTGLLDETHLSHSAREELLQHLGRKDSGSAAAFCREQGVEESLAEKISALAGVYGEFEETLERAESLAVNDKMYEALSQLRDIYKVLCAAGEEKGLRLDFSIINDLSYYNGIIFQGFIDGVPCGVLSGGRYDNLLHKLGKDTDAIGFAVYLDLLERYLKSHDDTDVDVLLLYKDGDDTAQLAASVKRLTDKGFTVRAQKDEKTKVKYGTLMRFEGGDANA